MTKPPTQLGLRLRTDDYFRTEFEERLSLDPAFATTIRQRLQSPAWAVINLGTVASGSSQGLIPYDPGQMTVRMQQEMIEYWDDPPRDLDGMTKFLTLLAPRQVGKSLAAELLGYATASRNPGWDHVCDADTKDRAIYLHQRVHDNHRLWPLALRTETVSAKENRQMTFEFPDKTKSKMRVRSANDDSLGLGQSPDSYHASECAFWNDFGGAMSLILPSITNRADCRVVFECTPAPLGLASGADWKDHYFAAKNPIAGVRHMARFYPFWDGLLNRRRWPPEWKMDNEEIRLMERFAPQGLTKENLAFRRIQLGQATEFRKHPETFRIWYPFDDATCWMEGTVRAVPAAALERHADTPKVQWTTEDGYQEYEPPRPGAIYVIGADPCGSAGRDHAAFVVLEVWADEWRVVACYSNTTTPLDFANLLLKTGEYYNMAYIAVENNGVGQGTLSPIIAAKYKNLCYDRGQPGYVSAGGAVGEALLGDMVQALLDRIYIPCQFLFDQLSTYKHDKTTQESNSQETLRALTNVIAKPARGRREKHHWDLVSALMMATKGARMEAPRRHKPKATDRDVNAGDPRTFPDAGLTKGRKAAMMRQLGLTPSTKNAWGPSGRNSTALWGRK
jgi:hypothetical protein